MRAATHQQVEDDSVPGPETYPSGGFTIDSGLGRVDEVIVTAGESADSGSKPFDATATVQNHNEILVQAHSQASGVEVADQTEGLQNVTFSWTAQRL